MKQPTADDDRRARIIELRAAHRSLRQIAEETGLSKSTVARLAALEPASTEETPRDAAPTVSAVPEPAGATAVEPTPAEQAAELRQRAELLRREACDARRQRPLLVAEAQAQAQRLSARAVTADREAEGLDRRAADLENPGPNLPPGRHLFGRVN